jgi:hypothetical protein
MKDKVAVGGIESLVNVVCQDLERIGLHDFNKSLI